MVGVNLSTFPGTLPDPALDPVKMHNDVGALLRCHRAHIEQSYIYVDTDGASNWLSYVKQGDYAATVDGPSASHKARDGLGEGPCPERPSRRAPGQG